MTTFRWFLIVAIMAAIGSVDRAVCAKDTISAAAVAFDNAAGDSAISAPPTAAPAPTVPCGDVCPGACNCCSEGPAWSAFGEYLLLRPRSAGVDYAVPINGNIVANQVPLQIGATASVEPQFTSGFAVGTRADPERVQLDFN